jgi:hypothetical protein
MSLRTYSKLPPSHEASAGGMADNTPHIRRAGMAGQGLQQASYTNVSVQKQMDGFSLALRMNTF